MTLRVVFPSCVTLARGLNLSELWLLYLRRQVVIETAHQSDVHSALCPKAFSWVSKPATNDIGLRVTRPATGHTGSVRSPGVDNRLTESVGKQMVPSSWGSQHVSTVVKEAMHTVSLGRCRKPEGGKIIFQAFFPPFLCVLFQNGS